LLPKPEQPNPEGLQTLQMPTYLGPRRLSFAALVVTLFFGSTASGSDDDELGLILADAFRIDLSQIDVVYELGAGEDTFKGWARLQFTMRPEQNRPLFHFNPLLRQGQARDCLTTILLDGEALDSSDDADIRVAQRTESREQGFEVQRDVGAGEHLLEVTWTYPRDIRHIGHPREPDWFFSHVEDIEGAGNEAFWPTINSPEELARHTLEFRIRDPREYMLIGSGSVESSREGDVQVLRLDTGRELASYTVFFAVLPRQDVRVREFEIDGTPVLLASTLKERRIKRAEELTRKTLRALREDFGPFPAPFLNVLLIKWDGGMEYYGATMTGFDAISHELAHMYWGTSSIARTYRDSWWDEAIVSWWDEAVFHAETMRPIGRHFTSGAISKRSPIQVAFDTNAYGKGARMFAALAQRVGGEAQLIEMLAEVRRRRGTFNPFTTRELFTDLATIAGDPEILDLMEKWLFSG
jgi:hypothetical protein